MVLARGVTFLRYFSGLKIVPDRPNAASRCSTTSRSPRRRTSNAEPVMCNQYFRGKEALMQQKDSQERNRFTEVVLGYHGAVGEILFSAEFSSIILRIIGFASPRKYSPMTKTVFPHKIMNWACTGAELRSNSQNSTPET